jgi:hypothetical protein
MRVVTYAVLLAALARWDVALAQPGTAPATLENLLKGDVSQEPATAPGGVVVGAAQVRPAGIVARPKEGFKHPGLDKAWDLYDAAVAKIADSVAGAISKQFDAASSRGDLNAAEKWSALGKAFVTHGAIPTESDATLRASDAAKVFTEARAEFAKAGVILQKAYEEVTQSLTKDKKLLEARAVTDEWTHLSKGFENPDELRQQAAISLQKAKALLARLLSLSEKEWGLLPGAVFTVSAKPTNPCDTGIVLKTDDRYCFLPCPTDRWNTSPGRWQDVDFRGHDKKERASNGMPHMRLCYMLDNGPLRYVLESPIVTGTQGSLRFVPSDFAGGGNNHNNTGSVRVKVILLK